MNCSEVEIWIKESSDIVLNHPPKDVELHLVSCEQCTQKRDYILKAYVQMNKQVEQGLTDEKGQKLLVNIIAARFNKNVLGRAEWLMRIAAIFVVAFGILLGIFVGRDYLSGDDGNAYWSEEFAVITDAYDEILFE